MPIVVDWRYLEEVLEAIHDGHRIIFQLLAIDYVQLFGPNKTNNISGYKLPYSAKTWHFLSLEIYSSSDPEWSQRQDRDPDPVMTWWVG
jgi:hypothetical protein